ncbi:MAG: DegT/DnrJ/EryC1/StrS aminotransferase family protein [Rhodospirillaceae bacterium]|nr:DegT/DnrJ/EryC1/StrS aminotransferase family protein [Rhodospirillaceae bacterium]
MTAHRLAPWPHYADDEIAAVADVLRSGRVNYWTGEVARAFERDYAAACGARFGLAVANGTLALELALAALEIGPGDEVIVPARTFIATAAAVAVRGARPVIADIDPDSGNLTTDTAAAVLSPAARAIIPVHLAGWPADMAPILELARARGLAVIEDCAQAHGARDHDRPVGGIGHIGCFSFCQDKIITTGGEGGLVVTSDESLYRRMWSLRDHGRDYELSQQPDPDHGFRWLTSRFGTNARLTEPQAAIGAAQLKKLPAWVARRRANASILAARLGDLDAVEIPMPGPDRVHSHYRFSFRVRPEALAAGWSRNRVVAALGAAGVPARVGACPDIGRETAFARAGWTDARPRPHAAWLGDRSIVLPVHPTLTDADLDFMIDTARRVIAAAAR